MKHKTCRFYKEFVGNDRLINRQCVASWPWCQVTCKKNARPVLLNRKT